MEFVVWVKSKCGIRLAGSVWENVYSWHRHTVHETEELAIAEMSTLTPTIENPSICVRPIDDLSLYGAA